MPTSMAQAFCSSMMIPLLLFLCPNSYRSENARMERQKKQRLESLEEIIFVAPNLLLRVESATSLIKVFFISCCEFKVTIVTCVTASATLEVISICNFNYKFAKVSIEYVL